MIRRAGNWRIFADASSPLRLVLLTFVLLALWFSSGIRGFSAEEARLYRKVLSAQDHLWRELEKRGIVLDTASDPDKSGFIGVEWSSITTTLGSLESKRNAGDPLWAVQNLRWFEELGLETGDRIVVLSSSSFPGMLFSVLAAAEARGLAVDLAVSLGASTWGANRPEAPWPVLGQILREGGFMTTKPRFYTLGGGGENGGGMPDEGVALLEKAVRGDGGPEGMELFRSPSLSAVIDRKLSLLEGTSGQKAKLVVNIGGSEANMGRGEAAVALPPGLLFPDEKTTATAGDGVIGLALQRGIRVLHLLNLQLLADRTGIAFDARRPAFARGASGVIGGIALFLFALTLATHRRWTWQE